MQFMSTDSKTLEFDDLILVLCWFVCRLICALWMWRSYSSCWRSMKASRRWNGWWRSAARWRAAAAVSPAVSTAWATPPGGAPGAACRTPMTGWTTSPSGATWTPWQMTWTSTVPPAQSRPSPLVVERGAFPGPEQDWELEVRLE